MAIQSGSNEITNIQVGNTPITEVYSGSTKIWPVAGWKTIWEDATGVTLNPNESASDWIPLVSASTTSNKFRITYKYEFNSKAKIDYSSCYYRNPSQVSFTEETLPPQNTINTLEVERTSSTAKGVNLLLLEGSYYLYRPAPASSYTLIQGVTVRLNASTTGLLGLNPIRNGSSDAVDYVVKITVYKIEQYEE